MAGGTLANQAAQAAQWAAQFTTANSMTGNNNNAPNPQWEIARKALQQAHAGSPSTGSTNMSASDMAQSELSKQMQDQLMLQQQYAMFQQQQQHQLQQFQQQQQQRFAFNNHMGFNRFNFGGNLSPFGQPSSGPPGHMQHQQFGSFNAYNNMSMYGTQSGVMGNNRPGLLQTPKQPMQWPQQMWSTQQVHGAEQTQPRFPPQSHQTPFNNRGGKKKQNRTPTGVPHIQYLKPNSKEQPSVDSNPFDSDVQEPPEEIPQEWGVTRDGMQNSSDKKSLSETQTCSVSNDKPQAENRPKETTACNAMSQDAWPDDLKRYVARAFQQCTTSVQQDLTELTLKGKLTRAFNENTVYTIDWNSEPLPSVGSSQQVKDKEATGFIPFKMESPKKPLSRPLPQRGRNQFFSGRGRGRGARASWHEARRSLSRSRSRSHSPHRHSRRRRYSHSSSGSLSDDGSRIQNRTRSRERRPISERKSRKATKGKSNVSDERPNRPLTSKVQNKNDKKKSKNKKKKGISKFEDEDPSKESRLQQRAARFHAHIDKPAVSASREDAKPRQRPQKLVLNLDSILENDEYHMDWSKMTIIGTCQDIEKMYLRLTTAPDPSTVRPLGVLKLAINNVKKRWKETSDYRYACEQLKSIRQDLTVQCIRNLFTIEVYETHARIALEKGDHEEFNQCQTQLKALYIELAQHEPLNRFEFTGYRLLYYMFTNSTIDMTTTMAWLTKEARENEVVKFALELRSTWHLNNYRRFFKLYRIAPMMAGYLVDWFTERARKYALKTIVKSYRPSLAVSYIQDELAFDTPEECIEFLEQFNVVFTAPNKSSIDGKQSLTAFTAAVQS